MNTPSPEATPEKKGSGWYLAIFVTLLFVVVITAWAGLFILAKENQPEVIKIETQEP